MSTVLDQFQRFVQNTLKKMYAPKPGPQAARRAPSVSKYTPHQGEQEKARRRRQMAKGQL